MSVPLPRKFHGWKEPGGLQSLGSQRVGHNWATSLSVFFNWCHWGFLLVLPEGIKGVCPAWDAGSLSGMRGFWPQGTKTLLYSRAVLSLRYRPHAYYCETFLSPQTLSLSPFPHTLVTLVTLASLARDRLLKVTQANQDKRLPCLGAYGRMPSTGYPLKCQVSGRKWGLLFTA